jgi:hypothetical protein
MTAPGTDNSRDWYWQRLLPHLCPNDSDLAGNARPFVDVGRDPRLETGRRGRSRYIAQCLEALDHSIIGKYGLHF